MVTEGPRPQMGLFHTEPGAAAGDRALCSVPPSIQAWTSQRGCTKQKEVYWMDDEII